MKTKLNTLETRAARFCETAREHGSAVLQMEWRKNYEGNQAVILDHYGRKMAGTSGGGYDKESQALADVLRFLLPESDARNIWSTGGAGFHSLAETLAAMGWTLERIASTSKTDTFTLRRA